MNHYKRRDFLRLGTGLLAGFAAIPAIGCNTGTAGKKDNEAEDVYTPAALAAFGLQLYTLRDDFPKDPKAVLKQVADMGYTQIEGYEGDKGIFWGMSPNEFKEYTGSIGLSMVATHCNINKDFEKKAAEAAEVGLKYLISPWIGPQKSLDDFKRFADEFNQRGETCKQNGIRFAYHNHDYSFKEMDGQLPQDVMMANTDPALVDFEMDIYWVITGGQDPETWFKKYKDRFRLCHVKDRSKTPVEDNGKNSVDLGTGSIDFVKILKTARDNGMQYFIVEQEAYPNGTPLEAVKVDAEYMKNLKI